MEAQTLSDSKKNDVSQPVDILEIAKMLDAKNDELARNHEEYDHNIDHVNRVIDT